MIRSQNDALEYMGSFSDSVVGKDNRQEKKRAYANRVLDTELFPHLGINATNRQKAIFLGNIRGYCFSWDTTI